MGDGYFCCEKGQLGTNQGDCVDADTVVASTLAAQLVSYIDRCIRPSAQFPHLPVNRD